MKNKYKFLLLIITVLLVSSMMLAASYALWTTEVVQTDSNIIASGCFSTSLVESGTLDFDNEYPIPDEEGLRKDAYVFTIKNTCTIDATYVVNLETMPTSTLSGEYIKTSLNGSTPTLYTSLPAADSKLIATSTVAKKLTTGTLRAGSSVTYRLKMWMDYDTATVDQANLVFETKVAISDAATSLELNGTYREAILNGADPVLGEGMIPVTIADDGTVKRADTNVYWYRYETAEWANAVILVDNPSTSFEVGDTIPEADIESYFVWIPKYAYQIWNLGNYDTAIQEIPSGSNSKLINIRFGLTNTSDANENECTNSQVSGGGGNCHVGDYMTHPAFTAFGTNGLWVAKFETTGAIDNLQSKPGQTTVKNQTVSTMWNAAYNYQTSNVSHMMKNTEWGAVAYLSHSKYGIGTNANLNNNQDYKTGFGSVVKQNGVGVSTLVGTDNTITDSWISTYGLNASSTGNITGIYDMNGGSWEYVAAYVPNQASDSSGITDDLVSANANYFDIYSSTSDTDFNNRILGDATGEFGPFYKWTDAIERAHSLWYSSFSEFVSPTYPWIRRGGNMELGSVSSIFTFDGGTGESYPTTSFRIVLAPTN